MPDTPFAHGVARLTLEHAVGGSIQRNIFHVMDLTGGAGSSHYQALVNAFMYWWAFPDYGADAPSKFMGNDGSTVFSSLLVQIGIDVISRWIPDIGFLPIFGGGHGPCVPANSTLELRWRCAFAGRHGYAKTYVAGLDSSALSSVSSNFLDPAYADPIVNAYATLIPTLRDATSPPGLFQLCSFHRRGRPVEGGGTVWADPVRSCSFPDLLLDSQRPRLPKHRRNLT